MRVQVCKRCRVEKKLSEFYKQPNMRNGYDGHCKECHKILRRKHLELDPEKHQQDVRRRRYLRKYSITIEDYDRMFKAQGGRCAICGTTKHARHNVKYFAVDHDHVTGEVRGLLCEACNRGLGFFKDDIDHLKKAILYLSTN